MSGETASYLNFFAFPPFGSAARSACFRRKIEQIAAERAPARLNFNRRDTLYIVYKLKETVLSVWSPPDGTATMRGAALRSRISAGGGNRSLPMLRRARSAFRNDHLYLMLYFIF